MAIKIYQHRTVDQIYLFQRKDEKTLTLKVYDLARQQLSKEKLQLEPSQIQALFEKRQIEDLLSLFNRKLPSPAPFFGDLFAELDRLINLFKLQVPNEHKQIEKFTCPLTLEGLQDPVIDNCGHTFERTAIEEHQKRNRTCPLSRKPITSLTPNLQIRQAIEEWQKEDLIPTFSSFKKDNGNFARRNLETAQEFIGEGEYEEALDSYAKAFQYTRKWEDYAPLINLFQKMGSPQKAYLATLYLAKYQLLAKAQSQAIRTLETLLQENNPQLDLHMLLIQLYIGSNMLCQALPLCKATASACEKTHPQKAILLYQCILTHNPIAWDTYLSIGNLLSAPQEKAHLFLTGTCAAIDYYRTSKQDDIADLALVMCERAQQLFPNPLVDRLICLQLFNPDDPRLIQILKTLAQGYERCQDLKQSAKVYRHLTTLNSDPFYCIKFLQLEPKKGIHSALKWLQTLLQEKDYASAETLAQEVLNILPKHPLPDPVPLYTTLADLYRHKQSFKLEKILTHLGKTHQAQGNLLSAQAIYQEAFQKFPTFEKALALAQILHLQKDRLPEAIQAYYEAASLSLLQGNFIQLEKTIEKIIEIDPSMQHLQTAQKVQLMTQKHLCHLTKRVEELERQLQAPAKPQQSVALRPPVPGCAFGKEKWALHFGDVGVEPPLPANIYQILQGPCPIWPGKKVDKTHVLVLIPKAVDRVPFTLKALGELIQKPKTGPATKFRSFELGECKDIPMSQSYWTLMTRDVLEGSRSQNYKTQFTQVATLAQKSGVAYTVPKVIEAATCVLMHHVSTGQKLFTDNPYTYTRCEEFYNEQNGWKMVVGGFSSAGLSVVGSDDYGGVGVGACRRY